MENEAQPVILEELLAAKEELRQQNVELTQARYSAELERQRYLDLFEMAPDSYLVTDIDGVIQEANRVSEALFKVDRKYLVGKPFVTFIPEQGQQAFRDRLRQLPEIERVQGWEIEIQPRTGAPIEVSLTVAAVQSESVEQKPLTSLHWLVADITDRKVAEAALRKAHVELELRVQERTTELEKTNASLLAEVEEKARAEDELKKAHEELEQRIQERTAALAQAVEALQKEVSEHRWAMEQIRLQITALEAAADGFLITDRDGIILWSNPAFERMTGFSSTEIQGKTPRFLKSGLHPPSFFQDLWSTILSGKVWYGETINRHKDGHLYIEEQTIAPLIDENGRISHFIAVKHDITKRKQAENLIAKNAARVEALAEISRSMVEAKLDFQATLNVLVLKTASLIGDACVIRLCPGDRSRPAPVAFYHPNSELLKSFEQILVAEPFSCEGGLSGSVLKSGRPLRISPITSDQIHLYVKPEYIPAVEALGVASILIVPLRLQGELIGTLALFRTDPNSLFEVEDETFLQNVADRAALAISNAQLYLDLEKLLHKEQAMREQLIQAEKLTAMGRMMASVAHELNNPLQTIKNCLFLIQQETVPDAVVHDYLNVATSETQRISNLVMQLREIYRPTPAAQMAPVELNSLLEEVRSLLLPHMLSQKVEWQFSPAPLSVLVNGIADQLKQVVLNLCFNAIEAMQPAGGTLSLEFIFDEAGRVGIKVQDSGPGISAENIPRLFDPFFTTKIGGTGLGLSISFEIVQRHSGYIHVESQMGHGATFTVWLPNVEPSPPTQ